MTKSSNYKIVSLFSGCGGLDLGFQQAGFDVVWANDNSKSVWETYHKNHCQTVLDQRSIKDIPSSAIPNCTGVIGGPPCQSWSEAGKQRGIQDQRGQLFFEYIRILKEKQPLFFLAENVPGMLQRKHQSALKNIIANFEEAGYTVSYKLLNVMNYYVPQDRSRVIFVGYHTTLHKKFNFDLLYQPKYIRLLRDAIEDLWDSALPAKPKNKTNGERCLIPNHEYMLGGFSSHYLSRNRVRSWHQPSFTIQAGGRHAPMHPQANKMIHIGKDKFMFDSYSPYPYRRLSVRECARIQTFPDSFTFYYRNLADGYKMIGNAVPVNFSHALAKVIKVDLLESQFEISSPNQLSLDIQPQIQNKMSQPKTNVLKAVSNLVNSNITNIIEYYKSVNRINAVGDALESFVKDIFANTLQEQELSKKLEKYEQVFSYFGNANNPPDFMILGGDAVEVKKITSRSSQIALNSSYPAAKLTADSPMITNTCRECESWQEKDLIYAIGSVKKQKLRMLWLLYGDCYAASQEVYERIKRKIASGVSEIPGVAFSPTRELGRVNHVDPLGITHLRVRGMWHIEHPLKVYNYLDLPDIAEDKTQVFVLMRESKYRSFSSQDRASLEALQSERFLILNVFLKSPDNPVKRIPAKLITYQM